MNIVYLLCFAVLYELLFAYDKAALICLKSGKVTLVKASLRSMQDHMDVRKQKSTWKLFLMPFPAIKYRQNEQTGIEKKLMH